MAWIITGKLCGLLEGVAGVSELLGIAVGVGAWQGS